MKKIRTLFGIQEYQLGNGLRVLYRQERSAPVVAVCVTYHVGSRNEGKGHTGATHILEHLLFKDSKNFNRANGKPITTHLEWLGALNNATTWNDRTNYFELVAKGDVEEALSMEADRMRGSLFTDADLASEMTVVRNEYERSRNDPFEVLEEAIWAKAFQKHPYRIPTIGIKADIENSTAAKLREFYDTFYWPNNATLSVIGDVPFAAVKKLVLKHFGPIPRSPQPIPKLRVREPRQGAPRKVMVRKQGGVSVASVAYKIPEATHADYAATYMLATVAAEGLGSRLMRALVDTGRAASVSCYYYALHDPGLMVFTAQTAGSTSPSALLTIIRKELFKLAKGKVEESEVRRACEQILTGLAAGNDGVFKETRMLSESIAAGDWALRHRLLGACKNITARDIERAAKKYLTSAGETSGLLIGT